MYVVFVDDRWHRDVPLPGIPSHIFQYLKVTQTQHLVLRHSAMYWVPHEQKRKEKEKITIETNLVFTALVIAYNHDQIPLLPLSSTAHSLKSPRKGQVLFVYLM